MKPGEYAVHYSSFDHAPGTPPACTIFSSLEEAESYARQETTARPDLRCRIYDHHGFIGAPMREVRGSKFKGDSEISSRFRRWVGSALFLSGSLLILLDWTHDFSLSWPAMIGTRLFFPGLFLLVTEAILMLLARQKPIRSAK